jgi:hypothetical protein
VTTMAKYLFYLLICSSAMAPNKLIADSVELPSSEVLTPRPLCRGTDLRILGAKRTQEIWLRDYLNLNLPADVTQNQLDQIRTKILTTDIYSDAKAEVEKFSPSGQDCTINVTISEKWTTIPVIRGAYGGGTPLLVVGGYETNAGGTLKLLGAEMRRYGNRPPGFYSFLKSPKAWRGEGSVGGELWLDRRRRAFYQLIEDRPETTGYADSEAWTIKFQILAPSQNFLPQHWQWGLHSELIREKPSVFLDRDMAEQKSLSPDHLTLLDEDEWAATAMPMLVYDHVAIDTMKLIGEKFMLRAGGQKTSGHSNPSNAAEAEMFSYRPLVSDLDLALHGFAGHQSRDSLRAVYFTGGFDSIRGLPDGIQYGTTTYVGNAELRWQTFKYKYLHLQNAVFYDVGTAFKTTSEALDHRDTSVGFGFRFAVPQVYRLLIRIDFGKSIGRTKSQGLSIGLGQFFHPVRLTF